MTNKGEIHYRQPTWKRTASGVKVRQYLAFSYAPCYPQTGRKVNAYPTYNASWEHIVDLLPPTTIEYRLLWASSKPEAIAPFKNGQGDS